MSDVLRGRVLTPGRLAVALVALAAASELKFRRRDAELALSGTVDAQIIMEMGVWALVVGLVLLAVLRRRDAPRFFSLTAMGPAMRIVAAICLLGMATSLVTGSVLSVVRSIQFTLSAAVALVAYHTLAHDDAALESFWLALRRAVVALALACSVLSVPWYLAFGGEMNRYRWFEMHPIWTAGVLGAACIMGAGAVFGLPDPLLRRRSRRWVFGGVWLLLFALLILTLSRGATAATILGLGTVGALSYARNRRGIAILAMLALLGFLVLGIGQQLLVEMAVRGQTREQLLSLTGRTALFGIAYDLFLERPWLGHGFLAGRGVFLERVPWAGEAHNFFIEIAISGGIVGLALYVWLLARVVRIVIGRLREPASLTSVVVREAGGLVVFVLVAGTVASGAAALPGIQWLAMLVAAVAADRWSAQRQARLRARGRAIPSASRAQRPPIASA